MIGSNTLLMGGSGTGKTHSARTLLKALRAVRADAKILAIFTEPRWQPLSHITCEEGLHIAYHPPTTGGWEAMIKRSEDLTKLPWDAMTKKNDPKKSQYTGFLQLLGTCNDFKCMRCGESFGNVTEQKEDDAIWFDGLSGLNALCMQMVCGGAVTRSQPQWGAAMESEMQFLNQMCYDSKSWFVMVGHLDKSMDEVNGGQIITPKALGSKNGGQVALNFDDVILVERNGAKFSWTNFSKNVDTKPGWLKIGDDLSPDFSPMVKAWKESEGA